MKLKKAPELKELISQRIVIFLLTMKLITYILLASMVSLSLNKFMEAPKWMAQQMEQSCDMDCCCQPDKGCENHNECEDGQDTEDACQCGCDYRISIQIVTLEQHFPVRLEDAYKSLNYETLRDNYQFQYLNPHFQPPRIA